ncbi:Utp21 specific WD40 associated putative domain-containing protein [Gamsiella multidivaricata]|uniref:Utp21 specific WD40 associated putative domain-containing protein n=1 Tax=Gamsiella multidivaricata TaxID=101098 RepID=UPI00222051AC|nr:Utp21 specific WD40 associated putative domain-containing protein [Gamsiella multidivaricata]KAI7823322.1 Utp21 specific WD40 associated putative domain-containing protein [Gamsiella multidivaricata]
MFGIPQKKARTEAPKAVAPRLFVPFRAIGYVTNEIPFNIQAKGQAYFLTTCVGTTFHIYDVAKMNLLFVGAHTSTPITALAVLGDLVFVACGSDVVSYKRAKEVGRFSCGTDPRLSIVSLEIFGQHIISICSDNTVKLNDHSTGELYTTIDFDSSFTVTTLIHPSTYLNKVLIGSNQGTMQLWNIRTSTMVYAFKGFNSPVTCFTQSPVVDVIAVGLLDGSVVLHNIRTDTTIMTMRQEGKVTAVSFRTDDQHVMATANMYGDIALWDLDRQKVLHVMKGAHDGTIPSIQFLNGQPILMTSGADNSVKQWIFDSLDGLPRLLKSRSGHHQPPTHINYYGEDGHFILSAGRDRSLRAFSTVRDSQSVELSQGSLSKKSRLLNLKIDELKLPLITTVAAAPAKEKEWDNILTAHWNEPGVRSWNYQRKVLGSHLMTPKDGSSTKTVAISTCGNFGFVGSASGGIDMFNMQSGIHRRSFSEDGHSKAVTGLQSDRLNKSLVSGSLDGLLKLWDIKSGKCEHTMEMPSPITHLLLYPENNILAVICDDLCIRIVDIENRRVVREFWGHSNRITDMTFSPDGHWLVSSSLDATIRTWDLPTGHMVDIFRCESIATSLSFSPTGDYLATAHVDNVGIFLWANRMQFTTVSLRSITEDDVIRVGLPTSSTMEDDGDEVENIYTTNEEVLALEPTIETPEQLTEQMITLSLLPKSKWQTLLNLDVIKARNKPKEAPKAPEKAPFFLNTLPGVEPKFVATKEDEERAHVADTKMIRMGMLQPETVFMTLLKRGHNTRATHHIVNAGQKDQQTVVVERDYSDFFDHLKTLNPSAVDFELRSMSLDNDLAEPRYFLEAIEYLLSMRRDFELAEAYLNLFLRIHGDVLVANPDAGLDDEDEDDEDDEDEDSEMESDDDDDDERSNSRKLKVKVNATKAGPLSVSMRLRRLVSEHQREWKRLEELFQSTLCLIEFMRTKA